MKRIILPLTMFLFSLGMAFGQIADTVMVPNDYQDNPIGAINRFIQGDTLANGDRENSLRTYKLEKDKVYFLDGTFYGDFDLRLIADEVEGNEVPPIVASTVGANGVLQEIQFILLGDGYIENIIFQMTPPTSNGESNAAFFLSGEGKNYEFNNVMIEWGLWTGMVTVVPVNKVTIKNCYFKNPQHKTNIWNGRGFSFNMENPADSVIMQNNTFFNMNSFAFAADISTIPPDYLLFDHNTIVNSIKFPLHSFWLPEAIVTNNLFYNAHSYGETTQDVIGQDPDRLKYGIINIDTIPSDLIAYYGINEEDRVYTATNNGFFYEQDIINYWVGYGLGPTPWMNERNMNMFADEVGYPNLSTEAPIVVNPGFINPGEGMPAMIQWMSNRRDLMGNTYWGWDPDGDKFAVQWPVLEDLSYADETMKTAAIDGYPLGDLNWWPEGVLSDWEAGVVGTNDLPAYQIENIVVSPTPAKDHLTIKYELLEKKNVKIVVYNLKGAQVSMLFSGNQPQGAHTLEWNIDNKLPSGIYLIRLFDEVGSFTKKVIIQK